MISTPNPPRSSDTASARDRRQTSTATDHVATLRHGSEITIRHVRPEDEPALLVFMQHLSPESRRLRFFSPACDLCEAARWAAGADGADHIGIVALDRDDRILAHAACVRMYGPRAEVAVEVDETHRHQGLATVLIARLAREAERHRIRYFVAEVLPDNHDMLAVFVDGFDASRHFADGEVDIEFPTGARQPPSARLSSPQPRRHV